MRNRRWAVVAAVVAVVVATVAVVANALNDGPPVIQLGSPAGADVGVRAAAEEDFAVAPMYAATVRFELTDGAQFVADDAVAYRMEPPSDLAAAAADLADRLGLQADVAPSPWGEGALQAGPDDGSGPTLWVGQAGDWNYSDPTGQPEIRCVEPGAPGAGVSGSTGASSADDEPADEPVVDAGQEPAHEPESDEDVERGEPVQAPDMCDPVAPEGVPDAAEARTAAEAFLAAVDLPGTFEVTEVYADEWSAWVTAAVAVDGIGTDLFASVSLGPEAIVTSASGTLAEPVEVARYPTVDAAAAVERLEGQGGSGGLLLPHGDRSPAAAVDDVPVDAPADTTDAADAPVSDGDEVTILPAPDPAEEPAERVVTLVSAAPAILQTIDADGIVWLLPGVRFTDADGGNWQIITVADDFLEEQEVPEIEPVPEPAPDPVDPEVSEPGVDPGEEPGEIPVQPETGEALPEVERLAEAVLGLVEADAVARIESAGLVARVVARDGESMVVTDDLRQDRINLRIDDDVVTEARVH